MPAVCIMSSSMFVILTYVYHQEKKSMHTIVFVNTNANCPQRY